MSRSITANRYAEALFQLGKEKDTLEQLSEELTVVREVCASNEQLNTFLKHPRINIEQKHQFIGEVLQGLQADVVNTLKVLTERRRTELLPAIIEHFTALYNDAKGIAAATVYSVRPVTSKELAGLELSFAKRLQVDKVVFENVIDPTILGGLKIKVKNRVYDGSASGRLKRIEKRIAAINK